MYRLVHKGSIGANGAEIGNTTDDCSALDSYEKNLSNELVSKNDG